MTLDYTTLNRQHVLRQTLKRGPTNWHTRGAIVGTDGEEALMKRRIELPRVAGSSLIAERLVERAQVSAGDYVVVDGLGLAVVSDFFAADFIGELAKRNPSSVFLEGGPPEWHRAASAAAASFDLPIEIRADYPPGYERPIIDY